MTADEIFLARSRFFLTHQYPAKLGAAVDALPPTAFWWRPNAGSNSVGNLVLHLSGNVRQWIVDGVGGRSFQRARQEEFDAQSGDQAAALASLNKTLAEADEVLAALTPRDLLQPRRIQGRDTTVIEAVYHVVEHFSMHLGQIVYVAKLHSDGAIQFYRDDAGMAGPSWPGAKPGDL